MPSRSSETSLVPQEAQANETPDPWSRYGIERPLRGRLRLGLLADDEGTLPAWAAQTVRTLLDSGLAELVLVAVPAGRLPRRSTREILGHPAYSIARATIWRTRMTRAVPTTGLLAAGGQVMRVAMEPTRDRGIRIAASDVTRIRGARLDILLRFGFGKLEGEVLTAARHGVWSFHHGDERRYRGRPAGFWELFDRSPEIGVVLQRLSDRIGDGWALHRAMLAVEPHSYVGTLNRVYQGGVDLPLQVCRDLLAGRALPAAGVPAIAPLRTLPGSLDVARVVASTVMARVQRLVYGAFVLKQWSIGRLDGGPERVLTGNLDGARWVRPFSRTQMLADPMIVPGCGGRVVLCEALDFAVGQGLIARVEVDDDGSGGKHWLPAARLRRLVELPVHLSFPTVVSSADGLILIPEAATSGGLLSARLNDTATSFVDLESAPGMAAVDPVVFRHEDRWWLACSERGPTARSHLWMFHGPGPRGPWTAHARNPVVIDAGCARAAGLPFAHAGSLYRPAQDGRVGYGRSIRVMRVRTLTPDGYAEDLAAEISPDPKAPFGLGVHTVSVEGDTIWIDGYRTVMHPLAGWFRFRGRRSSDAVVGRRIGGWLA